MNSDHEFHRICRSCNTEKPLTAYYRDKKNNRHFSRCKVCEIIATKLRRQANPERAREINRKACKRWTDNNREARTAYDREYRQANHHRISIREKEYSQKNRKRISERTREYNRSNPQARMAKSLRMSVNIQMRKFSAGKSARTFVLVGCTVDELRKRLEGLFQLGMSWDNYGRGPGKWHIDHIIPCSSFDLTVPEQQEQCFHWSNLQPLWELENKRKSDFLPDEWKTRKALFECPKEDLAA